MMFDEVREKLITIFEAAKAAGFSTLPVNYPGRINYDPSEKSDPFAVVAVRFNKPKQLSLGQRGVRVSGEFVVYYFYRPGTGLKQSTVFSDFLFDRLALRTIDGVVFKELSPYTNAAMEGWEGTLNVVPFQTEYLNL